MATRKKKTTEKTVVTGTHLTVTTHPDGKTELKWDDEALLNEVRNAILKHESTIIVAKPKRKLTKEKQ